MARRELSTAKAFTAFNPLFAERAQVEWEAYQWKSKDGTPVEGVLIYPPGKKGAKNLRMLTLIHGGPADADGNRFGADWYDWAALAAANGWLVFRPNYRGSSGYGDEFMLADRAAPGVGAGRRYSVRRRRAGEGRALPILTSWPSADTAMAAT